MHLSGVGAVSKKFRKLGASPISGNGYDDFADSAASFRVCEGISDRGKMKSPVDDRSNNAGIEQLGDLAKLSAIGVHEQIFELRSVLFGSAGDSPS